jgi:hypothetical protein
MNMKRLISAAFFLTLLPISAFAQDVVVKTDKTSYHQGEKIQITVRNSGQESIFSIAASSTPVFSITYIEKKDPMGKWEKSPVRCEWPECDIDFDGPGEIKAGQIIDFEWEPRFYQHQQYLTFDEGVYRITLNWQIRRDTDSKRWTWEESKSEEFSISQ